jgi:hypothetical protein
MTRLKYYSVDNLLYTDWFTLGPNLIVRGIINTETFTYQLVEFDSEMMYDGQASSLRSAKNLLKNQLTLAGVNFDGEIRKRS